MTIFTTEGIILKHTNFGEADRILKVLTPYKGKLSVLAKGVRRIKSRRGGNVEPLNRVKIQLHQGRGMNLLTEAESLQTFSKIKDDLALSVYGSHLIELTERLLPEEQPNPEIYKLLIEVLNLLEANPRQIYIRAYEVKLLTLLGFWSLDQIQAKEQIKIILGELGRDKWNEIGNLSVNREQAEELESILRYYLEKVLESPLKSIKVIEKLRE